MKTWFYSLTLLFLFTFQSAYVIEESAHSPILIQDSAGDKVVIWTSVNSDRGNNVIQSINYVASTRQWSQPITISDKSNNSWSPQLAIDSSGNVVAAWTGNDAVTNQTTLYASNISKVTKNSWGTWLPAARISADDECVAPNFLLSYDKASRFFVLWSSYYDNKPCACMRFSSASTFDGDWSPPITLSGQ